MGQVIQVPLELLDDGANVRSVGERRRRGQLVQSDRGLRDSIRELGVLQPITIVRRGKRFDVLYGHRRTTAARAAGLMTIPAIVEAEPDAKPIRQLVENQHRLPVNPIDIAKTLRAYLDEHPEVKQHHLAAMLGRSTYWVSAKLALLELETSDQDARLVRGRGRVLTEAALGYRSMQRVGRPRVFRLDSAHLDGDAARSASVVVALPSGGGPEHVRAGDDQRRARRRPIDRARPRGRHRTRRDGRADARRGANARASAHAGVPGHGDGLVTRFDAPRERPTTARPDAGAEFASGGPSSSQAQPGTSVAAEDRRGDRRT